MKSTILKNILIVLGISIFGVSVAYFVKNTNNTYAAKNYEVSFYSLDDNNTVTRQTVVEGGRVSRPSNPTKNGYTFKYWSETPNGSEYNFSNSVYRSFTLYGVWTQNAAVVNKYTVNFNLNGGSGNIGSQTITEGGTVNRPANPTRSGYTFLYWSTSTSGSEYNFGSGVRNSFTLYAIWRKNTVSYTVSFDFNGGSGTATSQKVEEGNTVNRPANPTRDGYTFLYWSTSRTGGEYNFGNGVNSNFTLYAIWQKNAQTPSPEPSTPTTPEPQTPQTPTPSTPPSTTPSTPTPTTYNVTFDLNGATGNVPSQNIVSGSKVTRPEDPVKNNSTFNGWATSKSCSTMYNFDNAVTSNITLYACFTNNYSVTITRNGLPYIDNYNITVKERETLEKYNNNRNLIIFDTTTYKMSNETECINTLKEINASKNDNQLRASCEKIQKILNCSTENCYGSKYAALEDDDVEEILYLIEKEVLNVEYKKYNYIGLYRDNNCTSNYNYSSSITSNINIYECFVEESKNTGQNNITVNNKKKTNIVSIIFIIIPILLVIGIVLYFIRKAKIANSVD